MTKCNLANGEHTTVKFHTFICNLKNISSNISTNKLFEDKYVKITILIPLCNAVDVQRFE